MVNNSEPINEPNDGNSAEQERPAFPSSPADRLGKPRLRFVEDGHDDDVLQVDHDVGIEDRARRWYRAARIVASRTGRFDLTAFESLETRLDPLRPPGPVCEDLAQSVAAELDEYLGRSSLVATNAEALVDRVRRGGLDAALLLDPLGPRHDALTGIVISVDRRSPSGFAILQLPVLRWADVLPMLPSDPDGLALSLAAGPDVDAGWRAAIIAAVGPYLQPIEQFRRDRWEAVVTERGPGWAIVQELIGAVADVLAPQIWRDSLPPTGPQDLRAFIAELLADVPLTLDHSLVAAGIGSDGSTVSMEVYPLFRAGRSRRDVAVRAVTIAAPPVCREPLVLAFVADQGSLSESTMLAAYSVDLEPSDSCRLVVRLDGPGRISLDSKKALRPAEISMQALLRRVPPQIDPTVHSTLDLVCVLDCIGAREVVQERVQYLREVVTSLTEGYRRLKGGLRLGIVGYADELHVESDRRRGAALPRLQIIAPGEADTVLEQAARLETLTHLGQDYPGLLEEALDALLKPAFPWRAGSLRSILFLGDRPPHPATAGTHRLVVSPSGLSWQERFETARHQLRIRCVSVRWPTQATWRSTLQAPVRDYAAHCWRTLGADGHFAPTPGALGEVAAAVDPSFGLSVQSLPLPLVIGELAASSSHGSRGPRPGGF